MKGVFYTFFMLCCAVLCTGSAFADTDKVKSALQDAIYKNCLTDLHVDKKVNANILKNSNLQDKTCLCVANDTMKLVDSEMLNAFNTGGWDAYKQHVANNNDVSNAATACFDMMNEITSESMVSKLKKIDSGESVKKHIKSINFTDMSEQNALIQKLGQDKIQKLLQAKQKQEEVPVQQQKNKTGTMLKQNNLLKMFENKTNDTETISLKDLLKKK